MYTLSSNENNLKTIDFSATPENKINSLRKINQTLTNKPIKLNKEVLKHIKLENIPNLNNKKIHLNPRFNPIKMKAIELKAIKNRSHINNNKSCINNDYIKNETAQNYFSKYKIDNNINNDTL